MIRRFAVALALLAGACDKPKPPAPPTPPTATPVAANAPAPDLAPAMVKPIDPKVEPIGAATRNRAPAHRALPPPTPGFMPAGNVDDGTLQYAVPAPNLPRKPTRKK